jgi:hypothetical protein
MRKLTSAQLFAPPKKARKIKTRLERAKLVIAAARERAARRAARMAQQGRSRRARSSGVSQRPLGSLAEWPLRRTAGVSAHLLRARMSQQSSLTQSAHSVRQVLTAYSGTCSR